MKLISLLLISCCSLFAINYYVSPEGSSNNNGLSPDSAFNVPAIGALVARVGDTVFVADGRYPGFEIQRSGSIDSPIVFMATGDSVIIIAPNSSGDGINIENCDWVSIDGFICDNMSRAGIRAVNADHITIRNSTCRHNYKWGIFTGFTDFFIAESNLCAYSEDEHGIYVSNSCDNYLIRANVCHHNSGNGLHNNGDINMGEDGINHNPIIEGNLLYENGRSGGAAINCDGVQNALIINNILHNNHANGITLYQINGGEPSIGAHVYNNTVIMAEDARWDILIVDGSINARLYNNIFLNKNKSNGSIILDPQSLPGLQSDYNIVENRQSINYINSFVTFAEWQAEGYGANSMLGDESIFTNVSNMDFSLDSGCIAVDAGTNLVADSVNTDFSGMVRPVGTGYDIGALEYRNEVSIEKSMGRGNSDRLRLWVSNPLRSAGRVWFVLPGSGKVSLELYSIAGKLLGRLFEKYHPAGPGSVGFKLDKNYPAGHYILRLCNGKSFAIEQITLIK